MEDQEDKFHKKVEHEKLVELKTLEQAIRYGNKKIVIRVFRNCIYLAPQDLSEELLRKLRVCLGYPAEGLPKINPVEVFPSMATQHTIIEMDEPTEPESAKEEEVEDLKKADFIKLLRKSANDLKKERLREKYRKPTSLEVYMRSLETDYKGEDTLFCDGDFLEQIFRKPIKKTNECDGRKE